LVGASAAIAAAVGPLLGGFGAGQHGADARRAGPGASALEDDAEVVANSQLEQLLRGQPQDVQEEIIRINTEARPLACRSPC
jgi:hypothetical protein